LLRLLRALALLEAAHIRQAMRIHDIRHQQAAAEANCERYNHGSSAGEISC